ncbi:MAG TPA: 16S rRNA (cytidine(1402)-2'-O)-methyltransferase [Acidimicrobiales bacterium]|nr:16S rRNA (cytidine(1402)-2'-O)-methyltransferase [Acidimicrobiales bacterium]
MRGEGGGGSLVLVSTPIGNLGDLSPRARDALASADLLCCEDTRRTRALLTHAGISGVRTVSLHAHNEASRIEMVLAALAEGRTVAVVSDAGTPVVSDPGARLVSAVAATGAVVTAVPGPSAALAALVVSGLPVDRFCFEGFLPRRPGERAGRLRAVAAETRTVVLFEAPGRLAGTLGTLAELCGPGRRVVVARELTKLHEEVWRGTLAEAAAHFSGREVRGEVALVLAGAPAATGAEPADDVVAGAVGERLAAGDTMRTAADTVAGALGVSRRRAYEIGLRARRNAPS